jgi:hypothetical protein
MKSLLRNDADAIPMQMEILAMLLEMQFLLLPKKRKELETMSQPGMFLLGLSEL